jgi:hypothetical protein
VQVVVVAVAVLLVLAAVLWFAVPIFIGGR